MHRPQLITWTTHTAEATTLLEATRLQKLYTYMCNIVMEFYLYSIVYIYLINSRLDVTQSVRHHFRTATLSSFISKMQSSTLILLAYFHIAYNAPPNSAELFSNTHLLIDTLVFFSIQIAPPPGYAPENS